MRRPKISLKKYFYFTLICALLLIFGFNLKEYEIWKTKSAARITQQHQQQQRQQHAAAMSLQQTNDDGDDGGDDVDDDDDISAGQPKNNVKQIGLPTTLKNDLQQQQHHQQQQRRNDDSVGNEDDETNALLGIEKSAGDGAIAAAFAAGAPSGVVLTPTAKPWFFRNGDYYPRPAQTYRTRKERKRHAAKLFPHQDPHSDRIVRQLMYVPHNYDEIRESGKLKTILLYNGLGPWNVKRGRDVFLRSKCPVDTCELTANRNLASSADMILYKDHFIPAGVRKSSNHKQVTMLYYLECPYHTQNVKVPDGLNWTATYRRDSDIVTPYEKWQYYDTKIRQAEQDHNYAANKTKKVAWFVSNCGARNGRLQYAHDLQKHIEVDIFGACGNYKCSRSTADKCFEILDRDYKFYLAFENSNCKDYITEKFFVNALNRNILPIVMGARPEDYEVSAPHRSYIHVDEFASPKELAEYLHILDQDDELYNSYFKWKGTGEFINTFYWCRVCAALHNEEALRKPRWYRDLNDWWRGTGVCTNGSWRNYKARKDVITDD